MASISANGSKGHHKFTLTVTEINPSVENNTSTISFSFELSPITKGYDWANWTNASRTVSYTVNINGTTYTGTVPNYDGSSTVTLKSGTQTVSHNTDGTKTISFYFNVTDTTSATYTSGNASANGTMALTPFETETTGAAPIITASVVDTNSSTIDLTGDNSKLIRYHSSANATMTAIAQGGASIDTTSYTIKNGSATGKSKSYTFYNVESPAFTFSVKDNKGYVGTKTTKVTMVEYVKLTCNMANSKPDADGDMYLSCSGNYFDGYFGAKYNSLTVRYSYSGEGVDTTKYSAFGSGTMTVSISGNAYTAYANLSGLDYQATYDFEITASDQLETVTSTKSAVKSKPIFHWGENDFAFEVPVKFNSTANFNELKINEKPVCCGTWEPTLCSEAVNYYEVQAGWYQRLGNVVTIGWQIKAYIYQGHENTELKITGTPYTPNVNAFGGGVAYGIYVPNEGYAFECWCVDTNEQITARLQPRNYTSAGNLNVSNTSYYPKGGGVVILAGTICYIANS